ncbi:MAG TPA: zf-HC2 domain-containing protein [Terriglobales bacterium]|nr:zf-HC2 domain-containing protein [Terriglobales bacterium]
MNCTWRERLELYAGGELPPNELGEFEQHLRSCHSCSAEAVSRMRMKHAIRAATSDAFAPSPDFRARLQNAILPEPQPRMGWWPVISIAATAVVALVVAGMILSRNNTRQDLFSEAVDSHVSTLASANPVDVVSTDRHTVKPWFQGKLPFSFNLPELQNSEFRLIGGRVSYLGQQPAAHLLFGIRKHDISVFILQDSESLDRLIHNAGSNRLNNFNIDTWSRNGLRYIVVSDTAMADLEALSDLLRASA